MNPFLSDYFNYLRYELNRSALTIEAYQKDISQLQEWLSPQNPDDTDFLSLTSSDVRAWLASQAKKGDIPRTLRRKIISLRSLFKWMIKTGKIKVSPLRDVPLPKIPKPLPDLVKPEEIEHALEIIQSEPIESRKNKPEEETECDLTLRSLVVEMLYSLGLRRAELASINDEDIDYGKGELKVTGKRNKQRIVPVPQQLLQKISLWRRLRDKVEIKVSDEQPLLTVKGRRISHSQIYRIVNLALADSSARKKSPHALRHSFASGMLNGGADIDSVKEFLGHASLATTQIYTHISLNEIKKAYVSHPRASKD